MKPIDVMHITKTIPQLFEEQVTNTPDNIAVICEEIRLTYRQLNERSNYLANYLKENIQIKPDDLIIVLVDRSEYTLIAILAILKSGAAYVPIDPDYPDVRIKYIIEDTSPKMILTNELYITRLNDIFNETKSNVPVVAIDSQFLLNRQIDHAATNPEHSINNHSLAYIIYTSGTTGMPKGVMIEHIALANYIENIKRLKLLTKYDIVDFSTNIGFDLTITTMIGGLCSGACVAVYGGSLQDIELYQLHLQNNQITLIKQVPSYFDLLIDFLLLTKIKKIILGGEKLDVALVKKLTNAYMNNADILPEVYDEYGPTETTVGACISNVSINQGLTLGKAYANYTIYILSEKLQPLAPGMIGELYIGGTGLARGYLNQPELTLKSFIVNPLQTDEEKQQGKNARLYKTGDLARYLPDGNIEYIGRSDFQVKIRGYRIELGEIENVLKQYGDVSNAVVVSKSGPNGQYLAAYVIAKDFVPSAIEIQDFLAETLPKYMLPQYIIFLDKLPLTINGKLNRDALPLPELNNQHSYVAPRNELEYKVCAIYAEILGVLVEQISMEEDFFRLGGNSILVIKLVSRLNYEFSANVRVTELFTLKTIEQLADLIKSSLGKFAYKNYVIKQSELVGLYEEFDLNNVQQAYYFGRFAEFELGNVSAHNYSEYKFGYLDSVRFEVALNKLIDRHLSLRSIFVNGKQQYLQDVSPYSIKFATISSQTELLKIRNKLSHNIYIPTQFPLFNFRVSKCCFAKEAEYYILHVSIDVLLMDGNSLLIFFSELTQLYHNPDVILPKLLINYRDYMFRLNEIRNSELFVRDKQYWLKKIHQYNFEMNLPLRCKVFEIKDPHFKRVSKTIAKSIWSQLETKALTNGISLTSIIMTLYGHVLSYWSNQERVCINLTLFNRLPLHEQVNDVIGDFTVLELFNYGIKSKEVKILDELKANHDALWQDIEHNLFDGIDFQRLIRKELNLPGNQVLAPVVLTSLLGIKKQSTDRMFINSTYQGNTYSITQTSQVWLDNMAYENEEGFVAEWDYVEQLFDHITIEQMHTHYCQLIEYLAIHDWNKEMPDLCMPNDLAVIERANSAVQIVDNFMTIKERVKLQPNAIAIIDSQGVTSYTNLWNKICSIAAALQKLAVKKGDLVAVLSEKGYQQVIATLGVMQLGAAYLPLHIEWPSGRIEDVLHDGLVKYLLVSSRQMDKIRETPLVENYQVLIIEELECAAHEDIFDLPSIDLDEMAYVMFTSGSTGKPKGVVISRLGAKNTIEAVNKRFEINHNDAVLALSELSFDLSVYDIYGLLIAGGTVVFPDQDKLQEPQHWYDLIVKHNITVWNSVPQIVQLLIDYVDSNHKRLDTLKVVLMSGDWIPLYLPAQIKKLNPNTTVMSLGGATECSIWSVWYEVNKVNPLWNSIPYGQAMPNQKMYILNDLGGHCPLGVAGEIYIGGVGVAIGYWNDLDKTTASFIQHKTLGRLYKTGDLGCFNKNGYIEFLGRKDKQIKISGYRIEIGEIEHKLSEFPGVKHALVIAKEYSGNSVTGNKYLAGYYVADKQLDEEGMLSYLKRHLPPYMIPKVLIYMEHLPLTNNAKLDLNALPDDPNSSGQGNYAAPKNALEVDLVNIWSDLLGVDAGAIGVGTSFFNLGGNSVLIIKLKNQLNLIKAFKSITVTDLFKYPTIEKLVTYAHSNIVPEIRVRKNNTINTSPDVAIIAMSGVFPGSNSVDELWNLLIQQQEGLRRYSSDECRALDVSEELLDNPDYIAVSGAIDDIDTFDPAFWGISGSEAKQTDPQIRKFLEHCWYVLENSGYIKERRSLNIGVYAGSDDNGYFYEHVAAERENVNLWEAATFNAKYALATKVSYLLGLTGPANTIDTACSTGLVSVVEACNILSIGVCDMALAGGVSLLIPESIGYVYQDGMIMSKDGHCRPFDKDSSGTVNGSAVGVVLLKRLSDAIADGDSIIGVIKGYATNNDGDRKISYTAPSVAGQAECILNAQTMAGVSSNEIGYVECHGTGTNLGDPIEVNALHDAFKLNSSLNASKTECILGGIKANIGHTATAAGTVGLIKVCLMLQNNLIPGQANFSIANPELHLADTNFKVITKNQEWHSNPLRPRLAGVSSFGIGGTNAHVLISEYIDKTGAHVNTEINQFADLVFLLSAKSQKSLDRYKQAFIQYLHQADREKLSDIAYTLQHKREWFSYRIAVAANSIKELIYKLTNAPVAHKISEASTKVKLVFMFPGQGSQYSDMAIDLYKAEPSFKMLVDKHINIAQQYLTEDLAAVMYPSIYADKFLVQDINQTQWSQIALFIWSYSLAKYLEEIGIYADAYIGHSIGEYTAATLTGVFSVEDAIKLVIARGKHMQDMASGSMLAVLATFDQIELTIGQCNCEIAAINAQNNYVISGTSKDIQLLKSKLDRMGISSVLLGTSHAFHSRMMEDAASKFMQGLQEVRLNKPHKIFASNLTGELASNNVTEAIYWCDQLRNKVEFNKGIKSLLQYFNNEVICIEIGAGKSLSSFVSTHTDNNQRPIIGIQLLPSKTENNSYNILSTKADIEALLWSYGLPIGVSDLSNWRSNKIVKNLPNYQFEQKSYWIKKQSALPNDLRLLPKSQWFNTLVWKRIAYLDLAYAEPTLFKVTLLFTGNELAPANFHSELTRNNNVITILFDSMITMLDYQNDKMIRLNPSIEQSYQDLSVYLKRQRLHVDTIFHTASLVSTINKETLEAGFYSILMIKQYLLSELNFKYLIVLTNGLAQINGEDTIYPFNGAMVGAIRSIKHELPDIKSIVLDIGGAGKNLYVKLLQILANDKYFVSDDLYTIRSNALWVETLDKAVEVIPATIIRDQDTILITGGLGGIGVSIATQISLKHKVNFILIGRHNIFEEENKSAFILQQIELIDKIKQRECVVDIRCLDLSDLTAVTELLLELKAKYNNINGVIHAAGVAPLSHSQQHLSVVKNAFKGKVCGIKNILDVIDKDNLNYLILTSSLASIMGDINRIEYAAANSYLDYLANDRLRLPHTRIVSINWPTWSDTGMSCKESEGKLLGDKKDALLELNTVNSIEGSELFYSLINQRDYNQIILSKLDIKLLMDKLFRHPEVKNNRAPKIEICEDNYSELEYQVAQIVGEVLGVETLSLSDDFFKLGGNSLLAVRLISILNNYFHSNVKTADIFIHKTVAGLSKIVTTTLDKFQYKEYLIDGIDNENLFMPFELSNVQQAYYLGRLGTFELGNVTTHGYSEHKFTYLNVQLLEQVFNQLLNRHLGLRTIFINGKQQYLEQYSYYTIELVKRNERELQELRNQLSHKIYATDHFPLFDLMVSEMDDGFILHIGVDALLLDEFSSQLLYAELTQLYLEPATKLELLTISYRDYMQEYSRIRESKLFEQAKLYWHNKLEQYNFAMDMPLRCKAEEIKQPKFNRLVKVIELDIWNKLVNKAKQHGVGLTSVVLAAYGRMLGYWTGQTKVCINLTLFNRLPLHPQINNILGDFTLLELFNYNDSVSNSILSSTRQIHEHLWQDIEHNIFDGIDFQRLIRHEKNLANNQIIAPVVLTSTLGVGWKDRTKKFLDDSYLGINYSITQTSQVWLDNKAYETEDGFVAEWDYVEQLFDRSTIEAMHEHYCWLIKYIAEVNWSENCLPKLTLPLQDMAVMDVVNFATQELVPETLFAYYENYIISNDFENNLAVIDNSKGEVNNYTYGSVISDSSLLARYILYTAKDKFRETLANTELQKSKLIAILSDKGYNQVIATLGIMKAGYTYLPLNIDWPIGRMLEVLAQGGVELVLVSKSQMIKSDMLKQLSDKCQLLIIEDSVLITADDSDLKQTLANIELPCVSPDDVAYVIFTSGSTGTPKGVAVSHSAALNTIVAVNNKYIVGKTDRVMALSELSFDLSVYDIFGPLSVGATVVFPEQDKTKDPSHWLELIQLHQISIWNSVPQLADLLISAAENKFLCLDTLRLFLLSGDWIPINLSARIGNLCPRTQVVSLGGATEGSIWSIWYEINQIDQKWQSIPYGQAMPNQTMYILNDYGEACPIGVIGEIHIGGVGVAIGYWNDSEKTCASFIVHEVLGRLYKTGDLGCVNKDGYIEFCGRKDNQVKISGYRVELEEISAQLIKLPGVADAIVQIQTQDEHNYIVAYLVPQQQSLIKIENHFNTEEFKLANIGVRANMVADYQCDILLDKSSFMLRKSYRNYLISDVLAPDLIDLAIERVELTLQSWFTETWCNQITKPQLMQFLAQISCIKVDERALPKYLYPSAGSSFSVQSYINLTQSLDDLSSGYYYYNPLKTSLSKVNKLTQLTCNGMLSFDLIIHWPAIEPLYHEQSYKFAVIEVGHILALLQQQAHILEIPSRIELYEEKLDQDNTLVARLIIDPLHSGAKYSVPALKLNRLIKNDHGIYTDDDIHTINIKELSVFTQSDLYSGRLLAAGNILLTIDGEKNIANLVYAGIYFQIISSHLYQYNLGSCMLGYEVYADVMYAMVIGVINADEKYLAESNVQQESLKQYVEAYIANQLPGYMLPYDYVVLEHLPLTSNGKVDIKQLTLLQIGYGEVSYETPRNELELKIVQVIINTLGCDEKSIGRQDDFFKLGGNSILAIKLVSSLNNLFDSNIKISDIFSHKTIAQIAHLIEATAGDFIYKEFRILEANTDDLYEPFALNNVQQAYYLGRYTEFELGNISTHTYSEYKFKFLEPLKLEIALNKLIKRHLGLRTIFVNGQQQYLKEFTFYTIPIMEFTTENDFLNLRDSLSHKIYITDKFPLFDFIISKCSFNLNEEYYILHISFDVLLMDGNSVRILFDELTKYYTDPETMLPELSINYRDYIIQLNRIRTSELYKPDQSYWSNKLTQYNFAMNLPLKCRASDVTQPRFKRLSKIIDKTIWSKLEAKALAHNLGLTSIVITIFGKVLSYWSNQDNVCINLTLFNRLPLHKHINNIIGDFTVLELFNYHNKSDTILNELKRNHELLWQDLEHNLFDGIDFQRLIREELQLSNSQIIAPVVLTSVLDGDSDRNNFINDSYLGEYYSISQTSQVWFVNQAYTIDEGFIAQWDYVEQLFEVDIIEQMHVDYCRLIEYLAETDWSGSEFSKLTPSNDDLQLIERINSASQTIHDNTLFDYIFAYIKQHSLINNIAVIDNSTVEVQQYTYAQLFTSSTLLARYIIMNHDRAGVDISVKTSSSNGKLIAILSEKGYNQAVATLGVMQSGHGYLPLNIDWPIGRIDEILHTGQVELVLISRMQALKLEMTEFSSRYNLIIIEDIIFKQNIEPELSSNSIKLPQVLADDIAYVIFTSGSTGVPKGVTISHRGALNTILAVNDKYSISDKDSILALSELSFDLSVYDLFGMFAVGGTVVLPNQELTKDPKHWLELVQQYQINIWNSVPQLAELFIDGVIADKHLLSGMRLFLFSGDWIQTSLPVKIKSCYPEAVTVSLGGATEASIWSIWYDIEQISNTWNKIPYGIAMPNQQMYILNDNLDYCPAGVLGEIYIGGVGLALNYYNDKDKTLSSFIDHAKLGRLYKTGDLGKLNRNGYIEFAGRIDNQVKLNGYRIELGEISAKLLQLSEIDEAFIQIATVNNQQYIVAHLLPVRDKKFEHIRSFSSQQLNDYFDAYLTKLLPEYMLPYAYFILEEVPLTANGKVDMQRLPVLSIDLSKNNYIAPHTDLESALCAIFAETLTLDIANVGINDDFFKLGGDSITAIRLIGKINSTLPVKLKIKDIFMHKNIQGISKYILQDMINYDVYKLYRPFDLVNREIYVVKEDLSLIEDIYPASYLQIGMLFEASVSSYSTYHIISVIKLGIAFELDRFLLVWTGLINKHQLLRTKFISSDIGYDCIVYKNTQIEYAIYTDCNNDELIENERHTKFDYTKAGLFRLLINTTSDGFDLILSFHHAIADGWSIASLFNEFVTSYSLDKPIIPAVNLSYAEFVTQEYHVISEHKYRDFWLNYLTNVPLLITSSQGGNSRGCNGLYHVKIQLDKLASGKVHRLMHEFQVSTDSMFLFAYIVTLSRFLNHEDVIVGLVVNNRLQHVGGDELFGLFLNTIPYRIKVIPADIKHGIIAVYNEKLQLYDYMQYPYGKIKELFGRELYSYAFNFSNFHVIGNRDIVLGGASYERTNIPLVLDVVQNNMESFSLELSVHDDFWEQGYLDNFSRDLKHNIMAILNMGELSPRAVALPYIGVNNLIGSANNIKVMAEDIQDDYHLIPRNQLELEIRMLFSQVLNMAVYNIGVQDSFFCLGGNSILAIRLVDKLNNHFNSSLKLAEIVKHKCVEGIALLIAKDVEL